MKRRDLLFSLASAAALAASGSPPLRSRSLALSGKGTESFGMGAGGPASMTDGLLLIRDEWPKSSSKLHSGVQYFG